MKKLLFFNNNSENYVDYWQNVFDSFQKENPYILMHDDFDLKKTRIPGLKDNTILDSNELLLHSNDFKILAFMNPTEALKYKDLFSKLKVTTFITNQCLDNLEKHFNILMINDYMEYTYTDLLPDEITRFIPKFKNTPKVKFIKNNFKINFKYNNNFKDLVIYNRSNMLEKIIVEAKYNECNRTILHPYNSTCLLNDLQTYFKNFTIKNIIVGQILPNDYFKLFNLSFNEDIKFINLFSKEYISPFRIFLTKHRNTLEKYIFKDDYISVRSNYTETIKKLYISTNIDSNNDRISVNENEKNEHSLITSFESQDYYDSHLSFLLKIYKYNSDSISGNCDIFTELLKFEKRNNKQFIRNYVILLHNIALEKEVDDDLILRSLFKQIFIYLYDLELNNGNIYILSKYIFINPRITVDIICEIINEKINDKRSRRMFVFLKNILTRYHFKNNVKQNLLNKLLDIDMSFVHSASLKYVTKSDSFLDELNKMAYPGTIGNIGLDLITSRFYLTKNDIILLTKYTEFESNKSDQLNYKTKLVLIVLIFLKEINKESISDDIKFLAKSIHRFGYLKENLLNFAYLNFDSYIFGSILDQLDFNEIKSQNYSTLQILSLFLLTQRYNKVESFINLISEDKTHNHFKNNHDPILQSLYIEIICKFSTGIYDLSNIKKIRRAPQSIHSSFINSFTQSISKHKIKSLKYNQFTTKLVADLNSYFK